MARVICFWRNRLITLSGCHHGVADDTTWQWSKRLSPLDRVRVGTFGDAVRQLKATLSASDEREELSLLNFVENNFFKSFSKSQGVFLKVGKAFVVVIINPHSTICLEQEYSAVRHQGKIHSYVIQSNLLPQETQ